MERAMERGHIERRTKERATESRTKERVTYRTLLEAAIHERNTKKLLELLQEDSPPTQEDKDPPMQEDEDLAILDRVMSECRGKDNPLHVGALHGNVDFVRGILNKNPKLTRELNSEGQSPLHLASARGHVGVVLEILGRDNYACFIRDRDGMIPLHLAAIEGRLKVLKELVKADNLTAFILTKSGDPILHLCAKNNKFDALQELEQLLWKEPGFMNMTDRDDNNILHLLSAKENPEVIRSVARSAGAIDLLKCSTSIVNAVNKDGLTPLDVSLLNANGLGFGRLKVHWWLVLCGARGLKFSRIISAITTESVLDGNNGSWFLEALLVVAVLMVTVAFQAGINPPGGVWQDTGNHNATLPNAPQPFPPKLVHHYAGQSVMSYMDPIGYKYFSLFNNITLSSSMLVIVMLLRRWHLSHWIFKLFPIVLTFISVWAMSTTYTISLSFLSSVEDSPSDQRKITSTTSLLLLGTFFIAYFVNILHASCLLILWSLEVLVQIFNKFVECFRRMLNRSYRPPERNRGTPFRPIP